MKKTDLPGKKGIVISLIAFAVLTPIMAGSAMLLGPENILTSMMMIISAILIFRAGIDEKPALLFVQVLIMNLGCGLAASLVHLNVWTGIVINLAVIFTQTALLFREQGMQIFFPFHLSYIYMMACSPVEFGNIWPRIILLVIGSLLCLAAQLIAVKKQIIKQSDIGQVPKNRSKKLFDTGSARFSFALRRALGVTAAWFFVTFFDIEYGSWLVLSVSSIITPYVPAAGRKLRQRFAGCTIGAIFFFLVYAATGSIAIHIAILAIAMYGSILFSSRYAIRYGCTTVMSLAVAALCNPETMIFTIEKPLYVLIGGLVAMVINRTILPHIEEE